MCTEFGADSLYHLLLEHGQTDRQTDTVTDVTDHIIHSLPTTGLSKRTNKSVMKSAHAAGTLGEFRSSRHRAKTGRFPSDPYRRRNDRSRRRRLPSRRWRHASTAHHRNTLTTKQGQHGHHFRELDVSEAAWACHSQH